MTYTPKYDVHRDVVSREGRTTRRGPQPRPKTWDRDRYYAYLKHRAQAHYRGEEYALTAEDWCELWPLELWQQRGRHSHELALWRLNPQQPWSKTNVRVDTNANKKQYHCLYK